MKKKSTGREIFRLAASVVMSVILLTSLTACGGQKYEAIDLDNMHETSADGAGDMARSMPEAKTSVTMTIPADEQAESVLNADIPSAEESESMVPVIDYEEVDELVTVTADALNVRAENHVDARIYVQLYHGDTLRRTGYHEEWSRVIYKGEIAYVATDMVAVQEEQEEIVLMGSAESDIESGEDGNGDEFGIAEAAELGAAEAEAAAEPETFFNGFVVAIDAGHQAKANAEKEPIGPSSETMKAKMPEGSRGTVTGVKEYELTLTVAQKLEQLLTEHGYKTVMVRNSHDVNLSNAERAKIANESDADIFIRLHANSMENSGVYGALAMCMTSQNPYNADLHGKSYTLSKKLIDEICFRTGTKNRGVQEVDNNGAINWSEIPVSVVELGFLSNPDEERWLQDSDYQDKIVDGIAAAVDSYFAEGN